MDTLHTVLRSIQKNNHTETKARRPEHLTVFREFLDHLDRAAKRKASDRAAGRSTKASKGKSRRGKR